MKQPLAFSFAGLLLAVSSIQARILHVPLEYGTIQAGIDSSVSGDTVLVSDGIYSEHLDFLGKGIHVMTENGPLATIINLDTTGVPMVTFAGGEDSTSILEGFTVTGDQSYWGIYCSGSSPTIYGNIISTHEVGILAENGRPMVRKNEIVNCSHRDLAPWNGGGIRLTQVSGSLIDSNTIRFNYGTDYGGAVFMEYCDSIRIERNIIYSDSAYDVSAIGIDSSFTVEIENNLILQNSKIYTMDFHNAAVYVISGADIIIENNIIAYNNQYGVGGTSGTFIDYNVFFANNQGDISSLIPGSHCIYANPLFVDYANLDFRIRGNSPCINAGDPESPPDPDGTRNDIGAFYAERGYIAGTVRDESNQPIDGVYVTTTDTSEFAITGIDGEYILGIPGNYEYDVFFAHPDYQELLVEDISVLPGDTASLDANLTYSPTVLGEIEGNVVDLAGEPIAGVNVVADYSGISDITDTLGYFRLSGLRPRSYSLFFSHDDYENFELPGVIVEGGELTTLPPIIMYDPTSNHIIYVPEDFTTIQNAIDNSHNGDTILVGPGTYHESLLFYWSPAVTVMARGDRDSTILQAPEGERAALFAANVDTTTVLKGFTIVGDTLHDGLYTTGGAIPIIYGNVIKNCRNGIRTSGGTAIIRKNEILECRAHGPTSWSSALRLSNAAQTVIDSNFIHDNFHDHGATVDLDACDNGTLFEHNIICSNQAYTVSAIRITRCPDTIIIANNTIDGNTCTDWPYGTIGVGLSSYAQITNNIISNNTGWGIYVNDATADVTYNGFYANVFGDIYGTPEGVGCLHSDPLLTNRIAGDFRLLGASPCIDSGDPATPNDPDGTLPDMGAIYAPYLTDYGVIQGSIVNQDSQPVESVTVVLMGSSVVDTSDSGGLFSLGSMPQGSYDIIFSHPDYVETTLTDIIVYPGGTTDLNIVLRPFIGCQYIAGDVNGSDSYNGLDITYGVNFFKGGSEPMCPFGSCPTPPCDSFFYCGDVNGSCSYNGLDVTYGVNYFKGGADPIPCPDCPALGAVSAARIEKPAVEQFQRPKRGSDFREPK